MSITGIISVEGLGKKYKDRWAVRSLSFQVQKGEIFGFLGPNGAGKTTTIKILTSQILPDEGSAMVMGFDIKKNPDSIRQRIGIIFEEPNLYERLTVYQNLLFFAGLYGKDGQRVRQVLDYVGLSDRAGTDVSKLSRGLKQRLLIARAILPDPEIIFMDEPTVGLDPHISRSLRKLVRQLKDEGKTIFLTTHYMEEADELSDRVAIINSGNIVLCDTPGKLKDLVKPSRAFIKIYGEPEVKVEIYPWESGEIAERLRSLTESGEKYTVEPERVSLEDVFIKYTGNSLE